MELLITFKNPSWKFKKKNIQYVFELLGDMDETEFKLEDLKVQLGNFLQYSFQTGMSKSIIGSVFFDWKDVSIGKII